MQEMLKEIERGLLNAVVDVDYERLSRGSKRDQEMILNKLRNSATLIVEESVDAINNPLNHEDIHRLRLKGFFANFEYAQIVSRFKTYKRMRAKEGQWVSGDSPFRYEKQND